ncbi:MAG: hypothetical protein ACSHX0_08760 [Akkermansiaceae bacterium]
MSLLGSQVAAQTSTLNLEESDVWVSWTPTVSRETITQLESIITVPSF